MRRRATRLASAYAATAGLGLGPCLGLGACAMGPDYQRPELALPAHHRDTLEPAAARSLADVPWWELFADPVLVQLIDTALGQNLGLRAAAARVEQYRELAGVARTGVWPHLEVDAQALERRGYLTSVPSGLAAKTAPFFTTSLQASWELDLWGRLRRTQESAMADFMASEEARRGITIGLVADVAAAYFVLRQLDAQRLIALETMRNYAHTRDLYAARLAGGTANRVPLVTGEAQLTDARAIAVDLSRQIVAQENSMSLLLGRPPGPIPRGALLPEVMAAPLVPAGLPAQLLERRPDVRRAEENLIAANAQIGIARASFFPQVSLTALAGVVSSSLSSLASLQSGAFAAGGQTSWLAPLLQGGRLRHQARAAGHNYDALLAAYEEAVLGALREVASALNDSQALRQVAAARRSQVDNLGVALDLAVDRYRGGVTSFLEVTTTQNTLFPARLQLVAIRAQQQVALVTLYRALGGGWTAQGRQGDPPLGP